MSENDYDCKTSGEVIKLIHDEYPAVRWVCARCGEYSATIFYDREPARIVACEWCQAVNFVQRSEES